MVLIMAVCSINVIENIFGKTLCHVLYHLFKYHFKSHYALILILFAEQVTSNTCYLQAD